MAKITSWWYVSLSSEPTPDTSMGKGANVPHMQWLPSIIQNPKKMTQKHNNKNI